MDRGGPALESFRPARSFGWAWLVALLVLLLAPMLLLLQPEVIETDVAPAFWINIAIIGPLAIFFLLTLVSLPKMRYDLTADEVVLTCGPLLTYRIPYREITEVRTATLTPSLWSSMRMPGLALWKVPYADAGTMFMCATRMAHDILVITAGDRRFGITPADEDAFLRSLVPHLPKAPVASPAEVAS